jgi:hypothetical protein
MFNVCRPEMCMYVYIYIYVCVCVCVCVCVYSVAVTDDLGMYNFEWKYNKHIES